MTIDQQSRGFWNRISTACKAAFFGCLIAGYPVHLYAFTNLIPNADGLSRVYEPQNMLLAGRWFLQATNSFNDYTQMPAAIGFVTLFLLGIAAAFSVDLLKIRSTALASLAGILFATFPCLGYTFLYIFTASAYAVSILLAVLSIWLARKGWLPAVLGAACLAMSMGSYQAYVTVAIALALISILRETMEPHAAFRGTLFLGLRYMACLALGAVLYYVVLQILLAVRHVELWSYLGMSDASQGYPFLQIPHLILLIYKQVFFFFFRAGSADGFASGWMVFLDLLALLLALVCILIRFTTLHLWKELWRPIGALAMLALLPLGLQFTQLLSPFSTPTPLMKYAHLFVYVAVLLSADLADSLKDAPAAHASDSTAASLSPSPSPSSASPRWRKVLGPAVLIWAASLFLFHLNTNNLLYTASNQAHQATESYLTRLAARIEDCPGYEPGMEVVIIGAIPEDQLKCDVESYAQIAHYSVPMARVATSNKHIYYYYQDWLNIPFAEPSEDTMISVSQSEAFQAMPLYPAQGSIQVLDGRLVVRLRETYTPKQDYELQYEHRY